MSSIVLLMVCQYAWILNIILDTLYIHCDVEVDCYNPIYNLENKYSNMLELGIFTDCVIKVNFLNQVSSESNQNQKCAISKIVDITGCEPF